MKAEHEDNLQEPFEEKSKNSSTPGFETDETEETSDDIEAFYNKQVLSAEQSDDEITNNDGSVTEAFDTAFHNKPGYIIDHSLAGSNRADFYEAREHGKSDAEEELDYLSNHQPE